MTIDIIQHFNFWAITIVTSSFSCLLFFIFRRLEFLFSDTIINNMMKNNFEADFSQKLYKKKIEEIRKLHRSIGKFKKLYKLKNEDLDNISDKRFKDIVDAYKRTHQFDRRNNIYGNSKKNYRFSHKKSKSVCFDKKNEDLDILKIIEEKNNNDFIANEKSKQIRYSTRIRDNNKYKFQSNPSKFNK